MEFCISYMRSYSFIWSGVCIINLLPTAKYSFFPLYYLYNCMLRNGLPHWLSSKESACSAGDTGDMGSIPGLGRPLGEGNGNPFQYSCLENTTDRGAWRATVHGVAKSRTQLKWLSMHVHTHGIQTLSVIIGHHSRCFRCSACELERNRHERTSETTAGFSVRQHGRHWHLEWTNSSLDQVAFQDFSIRGPQSLLPPYTATTWNVPPQHSRGPL